MAGKKIGIVLAVDGEKDFKQALSNANKEAQKFKSELNKLSAEYDGNANAGIHFFCIFIDFRIIILYHDSIWR